MPSRVPGSTVSERDQRIGSTEALNELIDQVPLDLRRKAFTHSSWVEHRSGSYERLAFLGDAVLSLCVSTEILPRFASYTAGKLTKIKAQAVSRRACAEVAIEMGVPDRLRAAAPGNAQRSAELLASTQGTLAEMLEAAIGACYRTFGFDRTRPAVLEAFRGQIDYALAHLLDYKSALQERLARLGGEEVRYRVVDEEGPPHDRLFKTVAEVGGAVIGSGWGRTKKESEQEAAKEALDGLEDTS